MQVKYTKENARWYTVAEFVLLRLMTGKEEEEEEEEEEELIDLYCRYGTSRVCHRIIVSVFN